MRPTMRMEPRFQLKFSQLLRACGYQGLTVDIIVNITKGPKLDESTIKTTNVNPNINIDKSSWHKHKHYELTYCNQYEST